MRLRSDVEQMDDEQGLPSHSDGAGHVAAENGMIFFRVITVRPSRAKTVRVYCPQQRMFKRHDSCIVFHDSKRVGDEYLVSVDAKSSQAASAAHHGGNLPTSLAAFSLSESNLDALREEMLVWSRNPKPEFFMKDLDLTAEQRHLVRELCQQGVFHGSQGQMKIMRMFAVRLDICDTLRSAGIIDIVHENEESISWQLSSTIVPRLAMAHKMGMPRRFFELRPGIAITDMSTLELWETLKEEGWEVRRAPLKKVQKDALEPYRGGDAPRVLYLTSPSLGAQRSHQTNIHAIQKCFTYL